MNSRFHLFCCCLLLLSVVAVAGPESSLHDGGKPYGLRLAGNVNPYARKVYIVQFRQPSAAEQFASAGNVAGKALRGSPRQNRFNKTSANVQAYTTKLAADQDRMLALAGKDIEAIYHYRYSLNGVAAKMTAAQANKLKNMPEVLGVWEDEVRPLATNYSPQFLGLYDSDKGLHSKLGLSGDGIVIGVIDSGITPEHPSLADTIAAPRPGACDQAWAENSLLGRWLCSRYKKMEDRLVFEPPTDWNGSCDPGERFEATDCNNKLIGARWFIDGALAGGPLDPGEIRSARDVDGHGTHTATTAAGNNVKASIYGSYIGRIEGMAPRARVAVYKACWLRPGDVRASCNTSDLANAIDAAVADGVDIINYSVGSSLSRITEPDDIALLAATKAGVLAVVAAGNDGPNLGTVGSPAGGPWVITAAASSRDGETSLEAMEITAPPTIANKYAIREANFTPTVAETGPLKGNLILANDGDDTPVDGTPGTTTDACEALTNGSQISGNIAFVSRAGCDFEVKIANAEDAGAIAVVVYNIAGDPIVMTGTAGSVNIPAVMIGQADGNLVLAQLDAGDVVDAVLDKGLFIDEKDVGNQMGSFSARGPGPVPDILKPDVSAPGINILAGFSPDAVNSMAGENFAYLSGTSMATPHVAGVAALLMQEHPDWTPAMIKSALMTTARQNLVRPDGETPAIPLDYGAGHIVPNDAVDPGLVYDVSNDEYDAFACGVASPAVSPERCDELASAGQSFYAADMNEPSIAISRLANVRTVSRRVTNVGDQAETYTAEVSPPPGISVDVVPAAITIAPGESVAYDVTFRYESGPLDLWRFGTLKWVNDVHTVYSSLAIKPASITAPAEITDFGSSGTLNIPVEFGYTGAYQPTVHGLSLPLVINGFVDQDPNKTFTFRMGNGVTAHLIDVPDNELYIRFALFDALTDGNDDLDMYVYYCPNDIDCTQIGVSGEPTSQEEFDVFRPAGGRYAVLIHGFNTDNVAGGPGANYQLFAWAFGIDDDPGNMTATGPALVNAGTTSDVVVNWFGLTPGTIYLGGISHNTPQGFSGLTIIRIGSSDTP